MERSRLLLITNRAAIHSFFLDICESQQRPFELDHRPLTVNAARGSVKQTVALATVAVVDTGSDPIAAVEVVRVLHTEAPALPIAALICCPSSFAIWQLQALAAAGVSSFLDLEVSVPELSSALDRIARGGIVLSLRLGAEHRAFFRATLLQYDSQENNPVTRLAKCDTDFRILQGVARGMTNREIANQLNLSPHTVHHRIERLRQELLVTNRTELAAWAGRHGLYQPSQPEESTI